MALNMMTLQLNSVFTHRHSAWILFLGIALLTSNANAHSGRTDQEDCHTETATNTRHCHGDDPVVPTTNVPSPIVSTPIVTTPFKNQPVPVTETTLQCNAASEGNVSEAINSAQILEIRLLQDQNTPQQAIEWAEWHLVHYPGQSYTWNRLIEIAQGLLP